ASTSRCADIITSASTSSARCRTRTSSRRCAAVRASAGHTRGSRRACWPIITFSCTVSRGKRLVFWKVRARPARAIRSGRRAGGARPVERTVTAARGQEAREEVEARRLAGAVGADQADDGAGVDGEADAVDGREAAEVHAEILDVKQGHGPLAPAGRAATGR